MADPDWFASTPTTTTGGTDWFADVPEPTKASKKKKGGHTLAGNLFRDIESAVVGAVPMGIQTASAIGQDIFVPSKNLGEFRTWKKVIKPYAEAEKYQYEPLLHGDKEEFYRRFHEHPLGPILDTLALVSLGAGRAAAVGLTAKGERAAALRTGKYQGPAREITAHAAHGGEPVAIRTLPRSGWRAGRMVLTDKALKSLRPETRVLGEFARAARAIERDALPTELRHLGDARYSDYLKSFHKLSPDERIAAALIPRLPLESDLAAWIDMLPDTKVGRSTKSVVTRPGVLEAYKLEGKSGQRVTAAVEAGRRLSQAREEIISRTTNVTPETLAEAPYRHMQTVRSGGVRPWTPDEAQARLSKLERQQNKTLDDMANAMFGSIERSAVKQRTQRNLKAMRQAAGVTRAGTASGAAGRKYQVRPTVKEERRAQAAEQIRVALEKKPDDPTLQAWAKLDAEVTALRSMLNPELFEKPDLSGLGTLPDPRGRVLGGSADELRAEIEAAGRPLPYYLPDRAATVKMGKPSSRPAWQSPPPAGADIRQSQNVLFRMGMLALDPDVLGPAFLRAVQHDYRLDLHERARQAAAPVAEGHGLPEGYRWLRETRGEKIPYTETAVGEHLGQGAHAFPEEYERLTLGKDAEETQIARDEAGQRLVVPERFAQQIDGEGYRAAGVGKKMVTNALQVWRGLVLHTRIPWLENNVVGNAILWTLRFAGINGLRAFVGMIGETRGVKAVRQILGSGVTRNHLTREDIAELYPTQRHGTFVESQFPRRRPLSTKPGRRAMQRTGRVLSAPVRALPRIDKATEQAFRRAGVEATLRGSPEVRAIYKSMPRETRNWREAMRKASLDPKTQRMVGREVDDALGSYLSLTPFERGTVRQLIPFYAWFREITRITLKLPLDLPVRTAIMAKLSQLEDERMQDMLGPLPSYLRGVYPLGRPGDDRQQVLALQAANPFSTITQLGRAGAQAIGVTSGGPRQGISDLAANTNPLISTLVRGRDRPIQAAVWEDFIRQLPQTRVIEARESNLYPGRTRQDLLAQYLGYPARTYSPRQARRYAKSEAG